MKRILTLGAAAAVLAAAAAAATPRPAQACYTCDWQMGCVWDFDGWAACRAEPLRWGGYLCEFSSTPCGGWSAIERTDVAPDGTVAPGSYAAAVRLASAAAAADTPGRTCDGLILARDYDEGEAAGLREASRRLAI